MASTERIVQRSPVECELTCALTYDEATFVIELYGELDAASAPELELVLERAEGTDAEKVVLDLSGLEFIDSAGVSLLVGAARRSGKNWGRLRMLRGTGQVDDLLKLCGVDGRLPFDD